IQNVRAARAKVGGKDLTRRPTGRHESLIANQNVVGLVGAAAEIIVAGAAQKNVRAQAAVDAVGAALVGRSRLDALDGAGGIAVNEAPIADADVRATAAR